ncbi:hypothetical protein B0H14DRAFT_3506845 [Mycena olivaceomarginata]|nr:hypothetical protein B0H14DRAFT_3506845 [Mycena olivaceomarginata]
MDPQHALFPLAARAQRSLAPAPRPPPALCELRLRRTCPFALTHTQSPHRTAAPAASFACYAFHTGLLHAAPIPHAQTIP